jgi:hypothetical protein
MANDVRQVFTFGSGHEHNGRYVVIEAESEQKCRELMFAHFDRKWSMQYNDEEEAGVERWGYTLLATIRQGVGTKYED